MYPSLLPSYLLLLLLFILLCEEGVNPPDLGEHAAICQAEAETKEPQAELGGWKGERSGEKAQGKCERSRNHLTVPLFRDLVSAS